MAKSLSIQAEFVRYVGPSILGLAGTSCYILADTYFISLGTGSLGLTALNIALPIFNIIFGLGAMVGIGAATRYALRQDEKAFTQALWLAALFSLPFLGLAAAPERLSAALGAKGEVLAITTEYLWVVLMFSPFFLLNTVMQCFVRNDGAPRLVMMGTLFGSLFNIVFDYIFIFPMGLGMFGAALATGCSPIVSLLVLSSHCLKKRNHFHCMRLGPRPAIAQDIARLGSAGFVTEVANGVVIFCFNAILLRLAGDVGVAAYGVTSNIGLVVAALFSGLSQGMQPLLSRERGRRHDENVAQLLRTGLFTCLGLAGVMYLGLFIGTDAVVAIFNSEGSAQLAALAKPGVRLYFLYLFAGGTNMVLSAYYSAVGQAGRGFGIALLRGLVLIVPMAFLLSHFFGITGLWLSLAVTDTAVLALTLLTRRSSRR